SPPPASAHAFAGPRSRVPWSARQPCWKQPAELRQSFFARLTGNKGQETLAIRFPQRVDPGPRRQRFFPQLWPEGGEDTTHSWRIRVAWTQIAFDDGPQSLTLGGRLCNL